MSPPSESRDDVERGYVLDAQDSDADKAGNSSSESDDEDGGDDNDDDLAESLKDLLTRVLEGIGRGNDFTSLDAGERARLTEETTEIGGPTALHMIVRMKKELPREEDRIEPLVKFLVQHERNLLAVTDQNDFTPLFCAIDLKKENIVRWMCEAHRDINSVLNVKGNNCIHKAIERRAKFLRFLVEQASPEILAAKDAKGNTPLHLAVEYKRCRKDHLALVELIATKSDVVVRADAEGDFNNEGQSPYFRHAETCRAAAAKEKKKKAAEKQVQDPGRIDRLDTKGPAGVALRDVTSQSEPSAVKVITDVAAAPRGAKTDILGLRSGTQQNEAARFAASSRPAVGLASSPVVRGPASIDARFPAARDKSKPELASKPKSESKVDPETVKDVERFLKLHYLRSRPYNVCMEILYGRNTSPDSELYFDLSGYSSMTRPQFGNLLSKLNFADILQYVAIPQIKIETTTTGPSAERDRAEGRSSSSKAQLGEGRSDFVHVFESLRKKNVKTIIKVKVDDSLAVPHSDESIENALRGLGVEVWEWKRTDLCSEVIYNVAPKVREVSLFWSGNNAVLRGWSDEGGLKRLKELQVVRLNVQHGLESRERTKVYVREFCERMKISCPQVTVHHQGPERRRSANSVPLQNISDQGKNKSKHEWIRCMREFKTLLLEAEKYYDNHASSRPIRKSIETHITVAIIDDGVDVKDLQYTFIGGRTFCTRDEEHNLNNPYYVSSAGHGTVMTQNVWDICPAAEFYVLRLDDHPHPSEDHVRQITPRSAAQAIRAAVKKKVHIICMSWTIDPPENDNGDYDELDKAISEAKSADILMFCAASDRGANQTATYPSKAAPNKIFTIGAASAWGAVDPRVGDLSGITLTFPGDKVELHHSEGEGFPGIREVSGSSVATALGAGLAALILYCVQVAVFLAKGEEEKEKLRVCFEKLRRHEVMLQAIKSIGTSEKSNHKFVEVWRLFGEKSDMRENKAQDQWIELVAEVGKTVCWRL